MDNVEELPLHASPGAVRELPAFKLERYFAKWEFTAPHLLCCSDCEPLHLSELLALADEDSKRRWQELRLGYGETRGLPALRAEVAALYEGVQPEGVIVAAPQECIYLAMRALVRPGDHVVVTYPGYQSLYQMAASLGCEVSRWEVELREDGGARFDVGTFKSLLQPSTRLAVVNFPHNPTGALPSHDEWGQLVEACRARDVVLFSDEMYRLMEFDPSDRLTSAVDMYDKAITLSGLSKAFGLPGLRIGWLAVRQPLYGTLDRVAELKDYTTICNSAPSEVLALAALRARAAILERNLGVVRANLAAVEAFMGRHAHIFLYATPRAGSVAFPRLVAPAGTAAPARSEPAAAAAAPAAGGHHELAAQRGGDSRGSGQPAAAAAAAASCRSPSHADCNAAGDTAGHTATTTAAGSAAGTGADTDADADAAGIEAFCERLVTGCGVLLLPGTVYDHPPSAARGHFRIGLGRRDLPACLAVLEGFLAAQGSEES